MAHIDLHLHSSVSLDGELSPRGLVELCSQEGITLAALTDHNAVSGIPEFSWRGAQLGIRVIPGVELDCTVEGLQLHILGYGIDITNGKLMQIERSVLEMQRTLSLRQMDAVEELGILLNRDALMEQAQNGVVSAEMIAAGALAFPQNQNHPLLRPFLPGGPRSDQPLVNFYWDICSPGKPAYVPVSYISAAEAIQVIHDAGGLAVLAHPAINLQRREKLIEYFLNLPLDGIEVFSSYHNAIETAFYLDLAQKYHLLITGGSDFHGKIKPNIRMGDIDMLGMEDVLQSELLSALETAGR
ncbi:MAG: PHP domain-containing protein [Clostridiales bacterium]|nr:PHP domain-containing protein [Clostridiales bacterium]